MTRPSFARARHPCFGSAMRVPLLDLSEQYRTLAEPIRQEFDEILRTQSFILGPKVEELERALAEYCGAKHAIGVSSGTDALLEILMALGIGPGRRRDHHRLHLLCHRRLHRAGRGDADLRRYRSGDFQHFAHGGCALPGKSARGTQSGQLVDSAGRIVRAIIPVHLFGLCCEMDAINQLAEQYQLMVIEDAAQAIGAEYPAKDGGARKAGTMSVAGSFSFYPSKNLGAAGDAGLIICDDDELAERFRIYRQHGMEPRYFHHVIGGNFRLDAIQAAILKIKLPHLDDWSAARRKVADFYRDEFTTARPDESPDPAGRALPGTRPDESSHLSPIRHPDAAAGRAAEASRRRAASGMRFIIRSACTSRNASPRSAIGREICPRLSGPRAKRSRCRSIRNSRPRCSAPWSTQSRSFLTHDCLT